jgi:selenocysteine lyase/cysteine desulfurase
MTRALIYLDTARLGRMSPSAQAAQRDFARLAGDEGGSHRLGRFLIEGIDPASRRANRYPGLASWRGVVELKGALRGLVGVPDDLPLLLANRSAQLMKFAARLLFHPCRNVMVTDLGWPAYHCVLDAERRRANRRITTVEVRDSVLRGGIGEEELVDLLAEQFVRQGCDGLFLTSVSRLGVRLPVERIVRSIEGRCPVRFVVVDGAQDFCHTATRLQSPFCDLYLAGCHKWLGAFHPMGLAFFGTRRSRSVVETVLAEMVGSGDLDDPLLRFSDGLERGTLVEGLETVNVIPLITARGAVEDLVTEKLDDPATLSRRLDNLDSLADACGSRDWVPLAPVTDLRSGIGLFQAQQPNPRESGGQALSEAFYRHGIAVTAYGGGLVRLSAPPEEWREEEIETLRSAFLATV